MNKTCTRCGKEENEIRFKKRKQDGYEWYSSVCLECHNKKNKQYQRKRRQENPEEVKAYHLNYIKRYREVPEHKEEDNKRRQEWVKKNPEKVLLNSARYRAKLRGLEFNLELEDIQIPEVCPILGIQLSYHNKRSAPSLDRVDNSKGYIKGNCRVISWRANTIKSDLSPQDIESFCNNIKPYLYGTT